MARAWIVNSTGFSSSANNDEQSPNARTVISIVFLNGRLLRFGMQRRIMARICLVAIVEDSCTRRFKA